MQNSLGTLTWDAYLAMTKNLLMITGTAWTHIVSQSTEPKTLAFDTNRNDPTSQTPNLVIT